MTPTNKELQANVVLQQLQKSVTDAVNMENRHKTISTMILFFMVLLAFSVAFANAQFNVHAILTAKFWVDFLLTSGGGLFLKWVFGRSGMIEGHKHPDVIEALRAVYVVNNRIKDERLSTALKEFIDKSNDINKTKAYKKKIGFKLRRIITFRKRFWNKEKENIRLQEKVLYETASENEIQKLYDNNFFLDVIKVKYSPIKEEVLITGEDSGGGAEDHSMNFNGTYEIFGKNIIVTMITISLSFFLAMIETQGLEFNIGILITFVMRVAIYILNAYLGYSIGKTAVEKIKLNKLSKINGFLSRFLEISREPGGEH